MVYLAFGSNLGNRLENIHKAYEYVSYIGEITQKSPVYESPALKLTQNSEEQPDFLNSVIEFETDLTLHALLFEIKSIEEAIAPRSKEKWAPRHLDIDILLFNDVVLDSKEIQIPHPELKKRNFVLKPLIDVAGNVKIPPDNIPAAKLLSNLGEKDLKYFADE